MESTSESKYPDSEFDFQETPRKMKVYYILGTGCTFFNLLVDKTPTTIDVVNREIEVLKKEIDENPTLESIKTERTQLQWLKHCLKNYTEGLKFKCVTGGVENIATSYTLGKSLYDYTRRHMRTIPFIRKTQQVIQIDKIKDEIIEDIKNNNFVLILGHSYGGVIANTLNGLLSEYSILKNKYTTITVNSIQVLESPNLTNYMSIGDVSMKLNGLISLHSKRLLDKIILKKDLKDGVEIEIPQIRLRKPEEKERKDLIWFCNPFGELAKCKNIPHVSVLKWDNHNIWNDSSLLDIFSLIIELNSVLYKNTRGVNNFEPNLLTLMEKIEQTTDLPKYIMKTLYEIRSAGGKSIRSRKKTKHNKKSKRSRK